MSQDPLPLDKIENKTIRKKVRKELTAHKSQIKRAAMIANKTLVPQLCIAASRVNQRFAMAGATTRVKVLIDDFQLPTTSYRSGSQVVTKKFMDLDKNVSIDCGCDNVHDGANGAFTNYCT